MRIRLDEADLSAYAMLAGVGLAVLAHGTGTAPVPEWLRSLVQEMTTLIAGSEAFDGETPSDAAADDLIRSAGRVAAGAIAGVMTSAAVADVYGRRKYYERGFGGGTRRTRRTVLGCCTATAMILCTGAWSESDDTLPLRVFHAWVGGGVGAFGAMLLLEKRYERQKAVVDRRLLKRTKARWALENVVNQASADLGPVGLWLLCSGNGLTTDDYRWCTDYERWYGYSDDEEKLRAMPHWQVHYRGGDRADGVLCGQSKSIRLDDMRDWWRGTSLPTVRQLAEHLDVFLKERRGWQIPTAGPASDIDHEALEQLIRRTISGCAELEETEAARVQVGKIPQTRTWKPRTRPPGKTA